MAALEKSRVVVVGLGGVGSWAAEALVRSGIGEITLVDPDRVCLSNVNRQAEALVSTVGRLKTEALEERLGDINPSCVVKTFPLAFSGETAGLFGLSGADYIIDAIDTMPNKIDLIEAAVSSGGKFFSSMGMARKLDPALIRTSDIWKTSGCPLARAVRAALRKRGFSGCFTAVYSTECLSCRGDGAPAESESAPEDGVLLEGAAKGLNGSAVTVTAAAGMILAGLVLRDVYSRCAQKEAGT